MISVHSSLWFPVIVTSTDMLLMSRSPWEPHRVNSNSGCVVDPHAGGLALLLYATEVEVYSAVVHDSSTR